MKSSSVEHKQHERYLRSLHQVFDKSDIVTFRSRGQLVGGGIQTERAPDQ